MIYMGIDPGLAGAAAIIDTESLISPVSFFDTPTLTVKSGKKMVSNYDYHSMAAFINRFYGANCLCAIEKVHSMPEQGVASSFKFGEGLGMWLGILGALEIPHQLIPPQRWKKTLMDGMGKEKDASRVVAMQLFPQAADQLSLKKHHGRADALLLAEYIRRTHATA